LGDALAVALLDARGFGADDFARSHPGGKLGIRLLTRVRDVMRSGEALPAVPVSATLADAVLEISRKGMGITSVLGPDGTLVGVYTDGDLRRSLEKHVDFRTTLISQVMTRSPRTVKAERLAAEAVQIMEDHRISQLIVVDEANRPVGALNMHDLFRARVI
jgi:arabinose-5-phosphate isomerase